MKKILTIIILGLFINGCGKVISDSALATPKADTSNSTLILVDSTTFDRGIERGAGKLYFDPKTEDYILEYEYSYEGNNEKIKEVFDLPTKIKPSLKASVEFNPETNNWVYKYVVSNAPTAKQNIFHFGIKGDTHIIKSYRPYGWTFLPRTDVYTFNDWGVALFEPNNGLKPGASLEGFVIETKEPPGIIEARFEGLEKATFHREFPEPIGKMVFKVRGKNPRYLSLQTLGPAPYQATDVPSFMNHIITLKQKAVEIGWIDNRISKNLDSELGRLKMKLLFRNWKGAENQINSFIANLESLNKNKKLDDNSYFLLKANLQFLKMQLYAPKFQTFIPCLKFWIPAWLVRKGREKL